MTAEYDFSIRQGETELIAWTWHADDDEETPFDLTGYQAKMQVRSIADGSVLLEYSTEDDTITLGDAEDNITLEITREESALLTVAKAKFDLFLRSPSDQDTCLAAGIITIERRVTSWD